jgi:hypothetical protein
MNGSKNLKSIVIANGVPGGDDFSTSIIMVFLAIHLAILKLIEKGFVLDISLVALLCLVSVRERCSRVLQPPSNVHTFLGSKNLFTAPLTKPLIPGSFVFSGPIISWLVSNRGGEELGARRMSSWSSNIEILLCSPIDALMRRTRDWG